MVSTISKLTVLSTLKEPVMMKYDTIIQKIPMTWLRAKTINENIKKTKDINEFAILCPYGCVIKVEKAIFCH